jgi:hypothetical protein
MVWSFGACRPGTSSVFARQASPVPGGAVPRIVSTRQLQCVTRGGKRIANVFALRSMALTPIRRSYEPAGFGQADGVDGAWRR